MHLLPACSNDLDSYRFSSLMIVGLNDFSESASAESFKELIPIADLFMFLPDVSAFEVVFTSSCADAHVVDGLLIYQFDPLVLREHLLILLDDFFARQTRDTLFESLAVVEMAVLDYM